MGPSPKAHGELFALRQAIARIEGKADHAARLVAGEAQYLAGEAQQKRDGAGADLQMDRTTSAHLFDDLMSELMGRGVMVELRGEKLQQAAAVTGFALALALMANDRSEEKHARHLLLIADPYVVREAGLIYAPGLADFGLGPFHLVHALPKRIEDALWLAEAALVSRAFSTVLLEVHGNPKKFGLTESRRLSLKARGTGSRLTILRQAGVEEASSASLRLSVEPAPAAARPLSDGTLLGGSIGSPVFHILAEKSRNPGQVELFLEWTPDDRRLRPFSYSGSSDFGSSDPFPAFSEAGDRPHSPPSLGSVLAFGSVFNRAS